MIIATVSGTYISASFVYLFLPTIENFNNPTSTSALDPTLENAMENHKAGERDMLISENDRGRFCADQVLGCQLPHVSDGELVKMTRNLLALTKERGISLDTNIGPEEIQIAEKIPRQLTDSWIV